MTPCSPGDVVLVRFPFTDLETSKKRPAVVLSPTEYTSRYGDVVLLALTSQPQAEDQLRLTEWQHAGLPKPTWFKPLLATVSGDIIVRRLGAIAQNDRPRAANALKLLVADDFLA